MSIDSNELRKFLKTMRDDALDGTYDYVMGFYAALDALELIAIPALEEVELTYSNEIESNIMEKLNRL